MSKKATETCCPVLALVLRRSAERKGRPLGIAKEMFLNFKTGAESYAIVTRFPMAKDRKEEFADATFAEFAHCPFCCAKLPRSS